MPTWRFSIGTGVTSLLSNNTWPPGSGVSSPAMMRSVVVLPQPEGPSSTIVSLAAIVRSSGCSARVPSAKVLLHWRSVIGMAIELRSVALIGQHRIRVARLRRPLQGHSSGMMMTKNTSVYAEPTSMRSDA